MVSQEALRHATRRKGAGPKKLKQKRQQKKKKKKKKKKAEVPKITLLVKVKKIANRRCATTAAFIEIAREHTTSKSSRPSSRDSALRQARTSTRHTNPQVSIPSHNKVHTRLWLLRLETQRIRPRDHHLSEHNCV